MSEDIGKIEYRVREIKRYVVTRYCEIGAAHDVQTKGEYENADIAHEVAYALAKHEHDNLGWMPGDERIQYPLHPLGGTAVERGYA